MLTIDGIGFPQRPTIYHISLATMSLRLDYRLYDPQSAIDLHITLLLQPIMILHHYCALPLYKGCSATILNFQITIKNGRDEWIRTTALQILSLLPLPLGYIPI